GAECSIGEAVGRGTHIPGTTRLIGYRTCQDWGVTVTRGTWTPAKEYLVAKYAGSPLADLVTPPRLAPVEGPPFDAGAFDRLGDPHAYGAAPPAPAAHAEGPSPTRVRLVEGPLNEDPAVSGADAFAAFETASTRHLGKRPGVYGYTRVDIETDRPVALTNLSDLHLGNKGTDHRAARADAELVRDTDGLYAVFGGDGVDNFVKHASAMVSSTSNPQQEYAALEWYLSLMGGKLLGGITGNHDYWTAGFSGVDYLRDLFRRLGTGGQPVAYGRHTLRLDLHLHSPDGSDVAYRVELRHTYRFKSSLNLSNQLQRMYDFSDWQWDVGMVGHTHDGPFCVPFQRHGSERWGLLAGSYKVADDHSRQWGYGDATPSSPVVILHPGTRRVECVNDLRTGAARLDAIRAAYALPARRAA
ncbi:MAG TPA: hypothetical protein VF576_04795, partial [Rubricoccaceae bacterium]